MIRYAAISTSGKRYKSDSRDDVDRWCSERVKAGEECEVYCKRADDAPYRCGLWRPLPDCATAQSDVTCTVRLGTDGVS